MTDSASPSNPQERRRERRIPINVETLVTIREMPPSARVLHQFRGLAADISLSGLQVRTRHLTEAQADNLATREFPIEVSVDLPYLNAPVVVTGRVMWTESSKIPGETTRLTSMGVLFDRLSTEVKSKINYVVVRLENESYDAVPAKAMLIKGVQLNK